MTPNIETSKIVVAVFTMKGCGACEDFMPRFQRIARAPRPELRNLSFAHYLPMPYYDVNDKRYDALCNRFGVLYTPTTLVLRRPTGIKRFETAPMPDEEIEQMLGFAMRALSS